jgi:uncharacterized RmlC-like cupin family protein
MAILVKKLNLASSKELQGFRRVQIFGEDDIGGSNISLEYVILPKGRESTPHLHVDTYSVIFTLQGVAKIYFGESLENIVTAGVDDSVYIPPNVIHYVVNEFEEEMIAIVARTPSSHSVKEFPMLLDKTNTK